MKPIGLRHMTITVTLKKKNKQNFNFNNTSKLEVETSFLSSLNFLYAIDYKNRFKGRYRLARLVTKTPNNSCRNPLRDRAIALYLARI